MRASGAAVATVVEAQRAGTEIEMMENVSFPKMSCGTAGIWKAARLPDGQISLRPHSQSPLSFSKIFRFPRRANHG
jgi:hypothetical protein